MTRVFGKIPLEFLFFYLKGF